MQISFLASTLIKLCLGKDSKIPDLKSSNCIPEISVDEEIDVNPILDISKTCKNSSVVQLKKPDRKFQSLVSASKGPFKPIHPVESQAPVVLDSKTPKVAKSSPKLINKSKYLSSERVSKKRLPEVGKIDLVINTDQFVEFQPGQNLTCKNSGNSTAKNTQPSTLKKSSSKECRASSIKPLTINVDLFSL